MALKLVLIGPRGTIFQDGKASILLLDHLVEFIKRMAARGVRVALWSRHPVTITVPGKPPEEVEAYLSRRSGVVVTYYRAAYGLLPDRAKTDSVLPILNEVGVERHETILVGNDETDLRAGVNNKLLLIRPGWYPSPLEYGFAVNDFSELIQFCELFALRQHPIYWSIDRGTLSVKAMGPFSTNIPDFTAFGVDARSAAKQGGGEPKFWFLMVVSSLYFSGLMHQVDYIARFPGHNPNLASDAAKGIDGVLSILGKCFNKTFLPDLILRHVAAQKSQYVPSNARTFRNHLNTLRLNSHPHRNEKLPAKSALNLTGKRVLVVDDICTSGRSLDVARAYIQAAGGTAVLFSWLKTINTSYSHMSATPAIRPFQVNVVADEPPHTLFGYHSHIIDQQAPGEISSLLTAYKNWAWP
jgi:hypothetical protein